MECQPFAITLYAIRKLIAACPMFVAANLTEDQEDVDFIFVLSIYVDPSNVARNVFMALGKNTSQSQTSKSGSNSR